MKLFQKTKIGNLELKNRFIRSATWEGMCENDFVSERLINLYEKLAKGGIGLIITGFSHVLKDANSNIGQMGIYDKKFIPKLKELTDVVHENNSKICVQLVHCGGQAVKPEGPSAIKTPFYKKIPEELSIKRINEIQDAFARASEIALEANFDAIQIHAAHGYLISQFLSPVANKRNDEYGGSLGNRARFLLEIYEKIRNIVSEDFPILIKINCKDFFDNGFTENESLQVVKWLENMGINAVEVSGGMRGAKKTPIMTNIDSEEKEAYWKDYSKMFKESLEIPVILVGGLRSYHLIEKLYNESYADFFSFSRPLIKEPDLIKKWEKGNFERAKCISCNKCFIPAKKGEGIRCLTD